MRKIEVLNYGFFATAILLFVILKFWYTLVNGDSLLFLLRPTNVITEWITGSQAIYLQGTGYYHESLNIVINKSCSGFNFMMLCFLMISFLGKKYQPAKYPMLLLPLSLLVTYPLTLFANSSRVIISILLESTALNTARPVWFHQAEGIFTYLFFLVLTYFVVEFYFTNPKFKHA